MIFKKQTDKQAQGNRYLKYRGKISTYILLCRISFSWNRNTWFLKSKGVKPNARKKKQQFYLKQVWHYWERRQSLLHNFAQNSEFSLKPTLKRGKMGKKYLMELPSLRNFRCFIWQNVIRKNKFWWSFTNYTKHWVIVLIPTSKLLAKYLLKLNLIKRLCIFSCMDLCKVGIIDGWLGDKSYLFISELSQKLCWIASPYLWYKFTNKLTCIN